MGAGPGDFGAERVLSTGSADAPRSAICYSPIRGLAGRRCYPLAVMLIALTANGSGLPYDLLLFREI